MTKKCKKCGKEIPENSNNDLCECCSRGDKKKNLLSAFLWGVVGVAVFVATKGKRRL